MLFLWHLGSQTLLKVISEGTFNAAFVPSYSSELIKGKDKAKEFANSVLIY